LEIPLLGMQLHDLKKEYKQKGKKRIGRGGKRGTTAGHGTKGQKSRAGHKIRPAIRDFIIKLPKRRGFKFKSIKIQPRVVNMGVIEKNFKPGEIISPKTLLAKKLINREKGKMPKIKILGGGTFSSKKFVFKSCAFSKNLKYKLNIHPVKRASKINKTQKNNKKEQVK
jgi:large subunit ribosomal protein L15